MHKVTEKSSEQIGFVSYIQLAGQTDTQGWVLSSGASVHVCNSRDKFEDYRPVTGKHVLLINNARVDVAGIGSVTLKFTSGKTVTLPDVVHIPTFGSCFVSIGKLTRQGFVVSIDAGKGMIYKDKKFVGNGCFRGGGLCLNVENDDQSGATTYVA